MIIEFSTQTSSVFLFCTAIVLCTYIIAHTRRYVAWAELRKAHLLEKTSDEPEPPECQ